MNAKTKRERQHNQKLAAIFRTTREELGITSAAVAERSGIDSGYYWRVERGQIKHPSWHTIAAIAAALGLSLDYLASV